MDDASAVEKVISKACHSPDFTDAEIEILKKMADVWRGLEAFGRVAGVVKAIASYFGWAVGAYFAFKMGMLDALRGALKL